MATTSSSLVEQMETDVIQETNGANGDDVQKEKELVGKEVRFQANVHHSFFLYRNFVLCLTIHCLLHGICYCQTGLRVTSYKNGKDF